MNEELKIGDWIRSYSAGIWKIYRILHYTGINPVSGEPQQTVSIFSKKFVSNSFKRSFKEECCSPDFVERIDDKTKIQLEKFIAENKSLFNKFCDYIPKPIDAIYNARIGIPDVQDVGEIEEIIGSLPSLKITEIGDRLTELGFNTRELPSWTAQFIAVNHECKDGFLNFKFHRVLKF